MDTIKIARESAQELINQYPGANNYWGCMSISCDLVPHRCDYCPFDFGTHDIMSPHKQIATEDLLCHPS